MNLTGKEWTATVDGLIDPNEYTGYYRRGKKMFFKNYIGDKFIINISDPDIVKMEYIPSEISKVLSQ